MDRNMAQLFIKIGTSILVWGSGMLGAISMHPTANTAYMIIGIGAGTIVIGLIFWGKK